jgi:hypothetical protein
LQPRRKPCQERAAQTIHSIRVDGLADRGYRFETPSGTLLTFASSTRCIMKPKTEKRATLRPLLQTIARDNQNKKALHKRFASLYKQTKTAIKFNPHIKHLNVPLEEVKESIQLLAHGEFYGELMVKVKKQTDRE